MKSTVYPDHPAPVLALRTVTYCTENEETPGRNGVWHSRHHSTAFSRRRHGCR